ncbi:Lipocalin-like domain-containing protein [Lachnospiraceae bacterium RM5]|nr:Lipocalin-like domain-containing protein [Lachnospiraceae bacterium RM5]
MSNKLIKESDVKKIKKSGKKGQDNNLNPADKIKKRNKILICIMAVLVVVLIAMEIIKFIYPLRGKYVMTLKNAPGVTQNMDNYTFSFGKVTYAYYDFEVANEITTGKIIKEIEGTWKIKGKNLTVKLDNGTEIDFIYDKKKDEFYSKNNPDMVYIADNWIK